MKNKNSQLLLPLGAVLLTAFVVFFSMKNELLQAGILYVLIICLVIYIIISKKEVKKIFRQHNQLEEKLKNSENYIQSVFESQENITVVTNGTYLTKANKAFYEHLGYKSLESFHKQHNCLSEFFEYVPDLEYISLRSYGIDWLSVVVEKKNNKIDTKAKINNDVFSINAKKIDGVNTGEYVVMLTNVSDMVNYQKKLEYQVNQVVQKLEKQNEIILKQEKQAVLGDLIGIIAHQLKQPLNNIGLLAQGINEEHQFGDLTKESLDSTTESIMKKIRFMSETIDDFKDFFRPDKVSKEFSINECVEKTVSLVSAQFMTNKLQILYACQSDFKIRSFETELQQVVLNIISNSKDILLEKEIETPIVSINVYTEDNKGYIEIEDNGGGIPEDVLPKIFDSYFTTKGEKGTGIGLHLCKLIIEDNMNGKITAHTEDGKAMFKIELWELL
ncbi:MAG: HAMP domain-containing histidine kinase [Campylobacterales bacterium]|nr:HAMP domain-containing histidine kinase [Campylobacterales bacterium]